MRSFLCDVLSLSLSEVKASLCGSGAVKERHGGAGEEGALDFNWFRVFASESVKFVAQKPRPQKIRNCLIFSSKEENEKQRTNANAQSPFSSIEQTQMSSSLAFQASVLSARSAVRRGSRAVRDFLSIYFFIFRSFRVKFCSRIF